MCIGIPMRVVASDGAVALCEGRGRRERLNMLLVGAIAPGDWVLAFQGSAVRTLTADEAGETGAALDALEAALAGETDVRAFFADLIDREPQLPEFLRAHPIAASESHEDPPA